MVLSSKADSYKDDLISYLQLFIYMWIGSGSSESERTNRWFILDYLIKNRGDDKRAVRQYYLELQSGS